MNISRYWVLIIPVFLLSCDYQVMKNCNNIEDVKVGMTVSDVDSIMGIEVRKTSYLKDPDRFIFQYAGPAAASDDLRVIFSNDSLVIDIHNGD